MTETPEAPRFVHHQLTAYAKQAVDTGDIAADNRVNKVMASTILNSSAVGVELVSGKTDTVGCGLIEPGPLGAYSVQVMKEVTTGRIKLTCAAHWEDGRCSKNGLKPCQQALFEDTNVTSFAIERKARLAAGRE